MSGTTLFSHTEVITASPADSTETIIATLVGVTNSIPGGGVKLRGFITV